MEKIYCKIEKCLGCRSCEIACAVQHSNSKDIFKAIRETPTPLSRRKVQAVQDIIISDSCHHCDPAPCVYACMSGAMYKDENGATKHNKDKCVGCWMCIMVCPFSAISRQEKIAIKCDLCEGRDGYACVDACPTKALFTKEVSET